MTEAFKRISIYHRITEIRAIKEAQSRPPTNMNPLH